MTTPTTSQIIAAAREAGDSRRRPGDDLMNQIASAFDFFADALERLAKEPEPTRTLPHEGKSYPAVDVCKHCGREARVGDAGVDAEICPKRLIPAPPEPEAGGEDYDPESHSTVAGATEALKGMLGAYKQGIANDTKPTNIFLGHVPGAVVTRRDGKKGSLTSIGKEGALITFSGGLWYKVNLEGKYYDRSESAADITHIAAAEVKGEEKLGGISSAQYEQRIRELQESWNAEYKLRRRSGEGGGEINKSSR